MRRVQSLLLAAAMILLGGVAARAETCTVATISMAFGTYDPLTAFPLDSTATISTACTSTPPPHVDYEIFLDQGQVGGYAPRAMTNGASNLGYNLFTDTGRTTVWGDGTGGTGTVSATFNASPPGSTVTTDHTVYGRIFAGQSVSTGSYSDILVITLVF